MTKDSSSLPTQTHTPHLLFFFRQMCQWQRPRRRSRCRRRRRPPIIFLYIHTLPSTLTAPVEPLWPSAACFVLSFIKFIDRLFVCWMGGERVARERKKEKRKGEKRRHSSAVTRPIRFSLASRTLISGRLKIQSHHKRKRRRRPRRSQPTNQRHSTKKMVANKKEEKEKKEKSASVVEQRLIERRSKESPSLSPSVRHLMCVGRTER